MDSELPRAGHIDYARWLLRVITWDGVLPVCLFLIPLAAKFLFPIHGGVFAFLAVALPIAALFFRIRAGCHHIDANNCGPSFQKLQVWTLLFGSLILVILDALLIVAHEVG
jgi:hypothetical protein